MSDKPIPEQLQATLQEQFNAARSLAETVVKMDADKAQLQATICTLAKALNYLHLSRIGTDAMTKKFFCEECLFQWAVTEKERHEERCVMNLAYKALVALNEAKP